VFPLYVHAQRQGRGGTTVLCKRGYLMIIHLNSMGQAPSRPFVFPIPIPPPPPPPPRKRPTLPAKIFTRDVFSSSTITYTCNDLSSYKNWIYSIKTLYPESYASSKYNLDNSAGWSDDKKNSFCHILEQTKITKNMSEDTLKKASVL
jgi:hypothetical protein